jgi:hypothetical protein
MLSDMTAPTLTSLDQRTRLPRATYDLLSCVQRGDGIGPAIDLGAERASLLVVCAGINHVMENERLTVSIWGSSNGGDWGERPLLSFPPKSYCGIYATFLNLAAHPDIRHLRASWNMTRWTLQRDEDRRGPLFGFYVSVQEASPKA